MRIDWKVSAISASAAFLLSVLVGMIGGVSFGALLVRAIIGAIIFGAGAVGVSVAIDRFLPELKAATASDSSDNPGGKVDIVVEGDHSDVLVGAPPDLEMAEDDEDDLAGDLTASTAEEVSPEEISVGDATELSDELSDELSEEISEEGPEGLSQDIQPGEADSDSDTPEIGDGEFGDGESEDVEELAAAEKLPDVEGFAESFSENPTDGPVSTDGAVSAGGSISSVDSGTDPADDPTTMAKAIRTLLKREE